MQDIDDLVREAQRGDLNAFSLVYDHFFPKVHRYITLRIGSATEAEDLTQEVFLKVMQALNTFQFQGSPFASWLFRIAHNLVVDRLRRKTVAGHAIPLDEALSLATGEDVEGEAITSLTMQRVYQALGQLTELHRQVILYRFVAGLSLAETASAMGRNVNAVKALQHSALKSLRKVLTRPSLQVERL